MSQYQQLLARELPALSHNLAKDLVTHRLRRLDEAAPVATRTGPAQQMFQALARTLARHLHETERREAHDMRLRAIARKRALQRSQHLPPVRLVLHVDEVDDDDAAE